ncbi:MAG: putative toxin-antitoxin system toxin component, PIN family [Treponemataceae bacterium]|nr:putative toxin-antitoxin system toxin component, PIN family [Treponemataceae bacterium]
MRIVIDTNVVASGIVFGGKPERLLELAIKNDVEMCVSPQILAEYDEIIARLSAKYPNRTIAISLKDLTDNALLVTPSQTVTVCRDPDDNKFIECAMEGKCLYIVSGDNDLLDLRSYADVEIVTVAEFFEQYGNQFSDGESLFFHL